MNKIRLRFLIFLIGALVIGGISLNAHAETIDEMFYVAEKMIIEKNYVMAIEKYSEILEIESEEETALLNRAYAFSRIGDFSSSLSDFSVVLKNNPGNMNAIEGKATILSMFECATYHNCPPLEGLQLFEDALKRDPTNEDLKMKRDFFLTKIAAFDIPETDGDYFANIQYITRDKDGKLVSVIQNSGTSIYPIEMLEDYLNKREGDSFNYKKEIVEINEEKYIKWHYENSLSESEKERKFYGVTKFERLIMTKSAEGYDVRFNLELLYSIIPAQNVDVGDKSWRIVEVFKKIQ